MSETRHCAQNPRRGPLHLRLQSPSAVSDPVITETAIGTAAPAENGPACLVVIYGPELGRRWMLERETVSVGRDEDCDVKLEAGGVSRRHCALKRAVDGSHIVEDLNSKNGTHVGNQELRGPRRLESGDIVRVGDVLLKYLGGESLEAKFHEEIYRMTIVDGLTETHNKRYFLEFLEREMSRCHRYGRALSLLMLDIDHFKKVNDTFGHVAGDYVLREVAALVRGMVRKEECFARYGGEEFALVMPEMPLEKVLVVAEKIRAGVASLTLSFEGRRIPVTTSIGVAQMSGALREPLEFVAAADERLYEAKRSGRNRVAV